MRNNVEIVLVIFDTLPNEAKVGGDMTNSLSTLRTAINADQLISRNLVHVLFLMKPHVLIVLVLIQGIDDPSEGLLFFLLFSCESVALVFLVPHIPTDSKGERKKNSRDSKIEEELFQEPIANFANFPLINGVVRSLSD